MYVRILIYMYLYIHTFTGHAVAAMHVFVGLLAGRAAEDPCASIGKVGVQEHDSAIFCGHPDFCED